MAENTEIKFIADESTDHILFKDHPNFAALKQQALADWDVWADTEIGDLTSEHASHIKHVSAGSVGAMRQKLSMYDCLNKMRGSRDNGAALNAAREAQRKAEQELENQREAFRKALEAKGIDPKTFGL